MGHMLILCSSGPKTLSLQNPGDILPFFQLFFFSSFLIIFLLVAQRNLLRLHFHCSLSFHPSHLQFCFLFLQPACIYVVLSFHFFPLFRLLSGLSFVYPALSPSPSVCICFYVCGSWVLVVIFQAAAQKIGLS